MGPNSNCTVRSLSFCRSPKLKFYSGSFAQFEAHLVLCVSGPKIKFYCGVVFLLGRLTNSNFTPGAFAHLGPTGLLPIVRVPNSNLTCRFCPSFGPQTQIWLLGLLPIRRCQNFVFIDGEYFEGEYGNLYLQFCVCFLVPFAESFDTPERQNGLVGPKIDKRLGLKFQFGSLP
jgi:hypothetical protein